MRDGVTATECRGRLTRVHTCVKENGGYLEHNLTFQFSSDTVIFLFMYVKQLIIINYQSLNYGWKKAVFCLVVLIYKRLRMWRHNDIIGRNKYLISTLSESSFP